MQNISFIQRLFVALWLLCGLAGLSPALSQTLDYSSLSEDNPASSLNLKEGYKEALNSGGWSSIFTQSSAKWSAPFNDDRFSQSYSTLSKNGFAYQAVLVSPALKLADFAGKTLKFDWSNTSVKGEVYLKVRIINKSGETLAEVGSLAADASRTKYTDWTNASFTMPSDLSGTGFLAFYTEGKKVSSSDQKRASFNVCNIEVEDGTGPNPDPEPNPGTEVEDKELVNDGFFYDFKGSQPVAWQTSGTVSMLAESDAFNASTGNGVGIATGSNAGYLRQIISAKDSGVVAGQELECLIHYYTVSSQHAEGPLRLALRWLDKDDKEIQTSDNALINNPDLWFGRRKTWGTLKFRAICPDGAEKLDFCIEVAPNSSVRLDDISVIRLSEAHKTPLVAILPQYLTVEGETGVAQQHNIVVQAMHIGGTSVAKTSGGASSSDLVLSADNIADNTTQKLSLTLTPSAKGAYVGGTMAPYGLTFTGADDENTGSLSITAYVKANGTMPTVKLTNGTTVREMRAEPSATDSQQLTFDVTDVISHVNLSLDQPVNGPFRLNTTQFYYSKTKDDVLTKAVTVTFAPRVAGDYTAELRLATPLADTLRIKLHGVSVAPKADVLVERFTAKQTMDARFTGSEWTGYSKFDRGYWKVDGQWNGASNLTLNHGVLYYDDVLPNGIDSVRLEPATSAKGLTVAYSIDGGGHWTAAGAADDRGCFAINTHRPTLFRFVNNSNDGVRVDSVSIFPATESKRQTLESIEQVMLTNADKEALPLLNEHFDGIRHTRILSLDGWQNLMVRGERPFYGWLQDNDLTGAKDSVAQISFYRWEQEDNREQETWLVSPTLSYKKAASKMLTFRLRFALPTDGGGEQFGCYIITEDDKVAAHYLDLNSLVRVGVTVEDGKWYDYNIDLSTADSLGITDRFHLAFTYYSPVGGSATTLNFMVDDVTFGRTDLPVIHVDKQMLTFHAVPGVKAEAQTITVTTERATDPVSVTIVPATADYFTVSKTVLTKTGGDVEVGFKTDDSNNHAAVLLLQTRSAMPMAVPLMAFVTTGIDAVGNGDGKLSVSIADGQMRVCGSYQHYAVYSVAGQLLAQGTAVPVVSLSAAKGVVIVKLTTAQGTQTMRVVNK